jgi:hypothetical protein
MAFTQQGTFTFLHSNQPDNLSSIMSAAQIKSSFDSQATELKATLNKLIVDLGSTAVGNSGAENIGTETITGVTGTNVQDQLASLKTLIDGKVGLTGGTVTGGLTVTGILLSNNSVRADVTTAGQTTLVLKNSADDSYVRVFTTAGNNYLASSNYGSTASKNLLITGYSGNNMAKLSLLADDVTTAGTITAGGNISEGGKPLNTKYLMVDGTNNYTGQTLTLRSSTPSILFNDQNAGGGNCAINCNNIALSFRIGADNSANEILNVGQTAVTVNQQLVINQTTPLLMKMATNDGQVRITSTSANNWIQSGTMANAPKNLTISGMNASTMTNVDILSNTVKISGNQVPTFANIQSGSVTITPVANTPTSGHVNFSPAYTTAPIVVATGVSAVPGTQVTGVAVTNITTTGCDIYVTRTNTNSTSINWVAVGI